MLGWTEDRFWSSTLREYDRAIRGYETQQKNEWVRVAWMTTQLMNVTGLGLGTLKRRVTLKGMLDKIPLFAGEREAQRVETKYTRADYEELKKKHAALHRKLWLEKQERG